MNEDHIGEWMARALPSNPFIFKQPWHLVESHIGARFVTNCGKQLERENRKGSLVFRERPMSRVCHWCKK